VNKRGGEALEKRAYEKVDLHSDSFIVDVFSTFKRKLAVPVPMEKRLTFLDLMSFS